MYQGPIDVKQKLTCFLRDDMPLPDFLEERLRSHQVDSARMTGEVSTRAQRRLDSRRARHSFRRASHAMGGIVKATSGTSLSGSRTVRQRWLHVRRNGRAT